MPSGWSADEHDCKVFIDNGSAEIRCKCGWTSEMTKIELWDPAEAWREKARAHAEEMATPRT